jgi:acyl-coenzyme A synthetase/AMP-(fatty) acid ligase
VNRAGVAPLLTGGLRPPDAGHDEHAPDDTEIPFTTSGHTGEPVTWLRTAGQLRAEAALVLHTLVGPVDRVVSYAPPQHLYGRVFGEEVPALLNIPVVALWDRPLTPPEIPAGQRVLLVCLPSTWPLLRGLAGAARQSAPGTGVVAVHGAGPLVPAARETARRLPASWFRAVEVFGSTETGAVAHRTLAPGTGPETAWTLFDDVDPVGGTDADGFASAGPAAEQRLRIRSPRLARRPGQARPWTHVLDDVVRPIGDRSFELLGRATRMIKVNGRRISLEHLETLVRAALPDLDVVFVGRRDEVRAEHYDAFCAGDTRGSATTRIQAVLRHTLPATPLPRRVHAVAEVPRSATGKVRLDRLLAAARTTSCGTAGPAEADAS